MHESQRLSHVRWECKYQVVIIATGMPNRSPQRGLPHVYGPLGGAFLKPRPMAVVGYLPTRIRPPTGNCWRESWPDK
jgi:hypothetical protein